MLKFFLSATSQKQNSTNNRVLFVCIISIIIISYFDIVYYPIHAVANSLENKITISNIYQFYIAKKENFIPRGGGALYNNLIATKFFCHPITGINATMNLKTVNNPELLRLLIESKINLEHTSYYNFNAFINERSFESNNHVNTMQLAFDSNLYYKDFYVLKENLIEKTKYKVFFNKTIFIILPTLITTVNPFLKDKIGLIYEKEKKNKEFLIESAEREYDKYKPKSQEGVDSYINLLEKVLNCEDSKFIIVKEKILDS